jgi:[pyruvate, water dikinase]-phosphate phosphotransferase / [pyruvate, water dikinase] kinase
MNIKTVSRSVFFVSDRTGITAENLGRALLTQFNSVAFEYHSLPYVNSVEKAQQAAKTINQAVQTPQDKPLVFSTLIDDACRKIIADTDAHIIDFFDAFIKPLEVELSTPSSHAEGLSHGISNEVVYMSRMDAINFALKNDDGRSTKEYNNADVILIGVSRSGKTPTCLYLAMQFGLCAANYPLTETDMVSGYLPEILQPYRNKLFGLMINAERLRLIREIRRQNSEYASMAQCWKETKMINALFEQEKILYIDSSHISVEEIATSIIQLMKISRSLIY